MVMEIGSYFFLCEGKEMSKMIISVLLAVFLLSCAAGQSLQKEPENIPVGSKSSERDDALSERLKALEQSVSSLRSEVANLGYDQRLAATDAGRADRRRNPPRGRPVAGGRRSVANG